MAATRPRPPMSSCPLGGDGFMLETLHAPIALALPIYGMNLGTVGFLLNAYAERRSAGADQPRPAGEALALADDAPASPTAARSRHSASTRSRSTVRRRQAAQLAVETRRRRPPARAGLRRRCWSPRRPASTAYNLSAHGPIIPLGAKLLALTPISPFRPRRWRGALLPSATRFRIECLDPAKRPVSAVADFTEVRDVVRVDIHEDRSIAFDLLFDPEHNLEERILKEQFIP